MTSITVLYGTTSANQAIPVLVDDAGQVVIDGGGTPGDSYWTLTGNTIETTYAISVNGNFGVDASGNVETESNVYWGELNGSNASRLYASGDIVVGNNGNSNGEVKATSYVGLYGSTGLILSKSAVEGDFARAANDTVIAVRWGDPYPFTVTCDGTVTCKTIIDESGYDFQKIGTALSTLHDVVESVDDLQGLKNLLKLVLDNLKSDIPPDSDESE